MLALYKQPDKMYICRATFDNTNDMNQKMPNKIKDFLIKIGLDDKASRVYLYLLSSGPQTASYIAKNCGLTRTNAYDVVKKLENSGLCFNQGASYGKKIKANQPKELISLINDQENEIISLKKELIDLLPLLNSFDSYKPSSQSQVSYFSGKESVKKLIRTSLQSSESELRFAGSELDIIDKLGKEFLIDYHLRRSSKKIFIKSLRPGIKRPAEEIFIDDKKYLREVRLRPEGLVKLKSIIMIWDNYVAFCSLDNDVFGSLIENNNLATMLKSWFDFIWNESKII